ncbi:hypothetical protein ACQKM1_25320 [Peribacillus frigoritolerans]
MKIHRIDHVGVIVNDLSAAISIFGFSISIINKPSFKTSKPRQVNEVT